MTDRDEVLTSKVAIIGFLGTIALFVIVLLLQVIYYQSMSSQRAERDLADIPVKLQDAVARQQAQLNGCEVLDREKGIVRIPIERAMDLAVRDAKGEGNAKTK